MRCKSPIRSFSSRREGFIWRTEARRRAAPSPSVMADGWLAGYRCLEHMIHASDELLIWSGSLLWFIVSFLFIKVDREHECFDLSVQNKSSVEQRCRLACDELQHPEPKFEAGERIVFIRQGKTGRPSHDDHPTQRLNNATESAEIKECWRGRQKTFVFRRRKKKHFWIVTYMAFRLERRWK